MTTRADVVPRVLRLANETHAAARAVGRDDLAELLATQAARWTESTATVVLAGAQKRGKSRLLNVLVGQPDLLPVDADIATHTHVSLAHGERTRVVVRRTDGESEIDPADLVHYASALGDPARRRDVTGVRVELDHPLLTGLTLVDTPGVDSLTLGHRHATVAALGWADALVFAVSAQDQPILRHELEFLAEAGARIHSVAFVLTKVEDSPAWQELLTENMQRLATFVERQDTGVDPAVAARLLAAPWFPVSAKLGEAALRLAAAGSADRAGQRRDRSGLPALEAHLRACAARRELVRAGGVLAMVVSVLRDLETAAGDRVAAAAAEPAAAQRRRAEVDAALAELANLRRERRRRGIDHHLLGREANQRARMLLDHFRRGYDTQITDLASARAVDAYLAELPDSIERSLAAAWTEVSAETERLTTESIARYLRGLGVDPVDVDLALLAMPRRARGEIHAPQPVRFDLVAEGLPAVMMGGSVSFLVSSIGALALPVAAPFLIGGAVAAGFLAHKRKLAAVARNRAALTTAVRDAFTAAANDFGLAVERAVAAWRAAAENAVDEAFATRQRELEQRRRALTMPAADPTATAAAATTAQRLRALTTQATALSTHLTLTVD
jgi:hypothetical protein